MLSVVEALRDFSEDRIEMEDFYFDVFSTRIFEFDIVAGVFAKEDFIADVKEFGWVGAIFADAAFPQSDHHSFLWFFATRGLRDDDTGFGHLFFFERLDNDPISQRLNADC